MRDLNLEAPYYPFSPIDGSNGLAFDISFGVGMPIDPTIGYFTVKQVHYYYSNSTTPNGTVVFTH